jgi:hypothetical protein
MSANSPPASVQVKTIAEIKSYIKQNPVISRHDVKHIDGTDKLWAHLEKLLRELKVPLLVWPGTGNNIKSIARDTLIYLVKICLSGHRFDKEPMVLKNVWIRLKSIRDPEETMEGGAGPDWYYMTVREDFPDKHSHATYIEGKVKPEKEDALDGLMEAVKEQIVEWEAEDKEADEQKEKKLDYNPAAAAVLQDSGPLEAHLQSLFHTFVPPVPWSEEAIE